MFIPFLYKLIITPQQGVGLLGNMYVSDLYVVDSLSVSPSENTWQLTFIVKKYTLCRCALKIFTTAYWGTTEVAF